MTVQRIGVHESVDAVFPAAELARTLDDVSDVAVVAGRDEIAACDLVVTLAYNDALLEVEWIHSIQAGVDRFPADLFREDHVTLTNSTGIHGDSVGETVAGYILAFAHRLHEAIRNQREARWNRPPWDATFTLEGETLCVVGLGTLGRGIADRAGALGMRVTGVKRTVESVAGVDTVYPADAFHDAIAEARFVALAVPLTDKTEGLIGRDALRRTRDDAYLINVARGGVVDEQALIDALQDGELAGAALDVFEREPLPESSPLWDMDDVIVTPHIAGVSRDYYERVAALVRENVRRIDADEPLVNRVV